MTNRTPPRGAARSARDGLSPAVRIVAVMVALLVVAGGVYGAWYLFLRPAGPDRVALPSLATGSPAVVASASPAASDAPGVSVPASSGDPVAGGIEGSWAVDASIGSFADFSSSFVGYRVQEQLASIGAQEAVGRTPDVTGTMTISGTQVTAVDIEADLTGLVSDDSRRDGQLGRQGLETDRFPTAVFHLTAPIELGSVPAEGQAIDASATGELTLHGQTRAVTIPLQARLAGGVIAVTGALPISFADYGMTAPSSFVVLSIADVGTLELQLFFARA